MLNRKLKANERDFINKLYLAHFREMVIYAKAENLNEGQAQEIVQATFATACENVEKLMASERPAGWLWQTLKYKIRNLRRHNTVITKNLVLLNGNERKFLENIPDKQNVDDDVEFLYGDLAKEPEFELLRDIFIRGMTFKAAAKKRGISLAACYQRAYRARKKLRKLIE